MDRAILVKAVSFAIVGLVNTGIDFGVFTFAYYYLGWHILVANADRLAAGGQQLLRHEFTDHICGGIGTPAEPASLHYVHLAQTGGLIANTATVFVLSYFMPAWMAKILAIGASFIVNFYTVASRGFPSARKSCPRVTDQGRGALAAQRKPDGRAADLRHPSRMRIHGRALPGRQVHNLSRAGKPLLVRYDLEGVRKALSKERSRAVRPISGAIASCCRCAARRTSSASARR